MTVGAFSMKTNVATQYHKAVEWAVQHWYAYAGWQTMGAWNINYDFQLGRMLSYIRHIRENQWRWSMANSSFRLISSEGEVIPGDLFHE